jgi:hypothetical protein
MAKVERSVEGTSREDLFGPSKAQLEFMAVNEHLAEQKRKETVRQVYEALPELWVRRGWLKSRVSNRDLFAAIVDEFGWKVLRSEYLEALRNCEKDGYIQMESSKDADYTHIH